MSVKENRLKGTIFFRNIGNEFKESPDLTPDEIKIIQDKLELIKEFNDALFNAKQTVLNATCDILIDKALSDIDSRAEWIKNILTICGSISGLIAAAELLALITGPIALGFLLVGAILATTAQFIGSEKEATDITGKDLASATGYQLEFNNSALIATKSMINYFKDNTNENRDAKFKINDKEFTLRDLLNCDIQKGTFWDDSITLAQRKYRNYFVTQQLSREQVLDLYFIQDQITWYNINSHKTTHVEHGHCFQPCAAPNPPGTQRYIPLNMDYLGNGKAIMNNSGFCHFNKEQYSDIDVVGNAENGDKDTLKNSFLNAMKCFIDKMPPAFIYPWSIGEESILWQRYYIVLGKPKLKDDANNPSYKVPDRKFLHWLFIDDGFGNIVNPDGVGFRYDILRTQKNLGINDIFLHAQQISNDTDKNDSKYPKPFADNIMCSSSDFKYGPPDSAKLNEENHVYTGDLMGFKNRK